MTTLLISDLHLEESTPTMAEIFLKFLAADAMRADVLYILGDFFEAWVGDDHLSDFNRLIMDALQKATQQGLPIYIMHGNRDFLLGKRFMKATGCRLLADEHVISLNGSPALLMHGDTLCTADVKYQKFRKKSRSWWFKKLVMLKSLEKRLAMAKHYRDQSKLHTSTSAAHIMDVSQEAVDAVMRKHQVKTLIHGHTHRPDIHNFKLDQYDAQRIVLGPWHEYGNVLVCDAQGKMEFKKLE